MVLNIPIEGNGKLQVLLKLLESEIELQTFWSSSNVMAIDRSNFSDHGPTHVAIIANASLKLLRNLIKAGVKPSIVADHKLENEDAEVIVFLASCMHDVGHIVHRDDHWRYSVPIASPILKSLLQHIYAPRDAAVVYGEILHAIVAHHRDVRPLTIEAGVVRIADALDMAGGRSRIPFNKGEKTIHSVSALAVEDVDIKSSKTKPITIKVTMTNSAGIFQVDNLLKAKIIGSGLEEYVKVLCDVKGSKEKKLKSFEYDYKV